MKKTRFAVKAFAAGVAATVLLIGSVSAPANAKDTGWNPVRSGVSETLKDTGWNPVKSGGSSTLRDTGWNPVP